MPHAIYFGDVSIIPKIYCDGYILDTGEAVLSERGTASLIGMHHKNLHNLMQNWPPKRLARFTRPEIKMVTFKVAVKTKRPNHPAIEIIVYKPDVVGNLIYTYFQAYAKQALLPNQMHIGRRCFCLSVALANTTLATAIKQACKIPVDFQKGVKESYQNVRLQLEIRILHNSIVLSYPDLKMDQHKELVFKVLSLCYQDVAKAINYEDIRDTKKKRLCHSYLRAMIVQLSVKKCTIEVARESVLNLFHKFITD